MFLHSRIITRKYACQLGNADLCLVSKRGETKSFARISSVSWKDNGLWIRTGNDTASHYFANDEKIIVSNI